MNRVNVGLCLKTLQRSYCTASKTKPIVAFDSKVSDDLENEVYKPSQHPGRDKAKCVEIPSKIVNAIFKSLKDAPVKAVHRDGQVLSRYLAGRHIPAESNQIKLKRQSIEEKFKRNKYLNIDDEEKLKKFELNVDKMLKRQIYHWEPIIYDNYKSLQYLLGRSAQEYSTIFRIFDEIQNRDPTFKPKSFFDFGSGVGTGIWAASELWKNSIFEYFLVDSSRHMNDLADLILRDGEDNKQMELKNVNFRQFFPANVELTYDIVLSAYSLFELPNAQSRLETILNLWNRCDNYLIIIERGTMAGFKLINEARDFILHLNNKNESGQLGEVFAPCPHSMECPRMRAADRTPCNFVSKYTALPLASEKNHEAHVETYSYVVFKKGSVSDETWPRIVRPTLVRNKHTICRMCTKNGKLEEMIFTKSKHGPLHVCARSSVWGDRLPIRIESSSDTDTDVM